MLALTFHLWLKLEYLTKLPVGCVLPPFVVLGGYILANRIPYPLDILTPLDTLPPYTLHPWIPYPLRYPTSWIPYPWIPYPQIPTPKNWKAGRLKNVLGWDDKKFFGEGGCKSFWDEVAKHFWGGMPKHFGGGVEKNIFGWCGC